MIFSSVLLPLGFPWIYVTRVEIEMSSIYVSSPAEIAIRANLPDFTTPDSRTLISTRCSVLRNVKYHHSSIFHFCKKNVVANFICWRSMEFIYRIKLYCNIRKRPSEFHSYMHREGIRTTQRRRISSSERWCHI